MKIEDIQKIVENHFKVDLNNRSRITKYYMPRDIYFNLCEKFTLDTIQNIASLVGYHHAKVVFARESLKHSLKEYPPYKLSYDLLISQITGETKEVKKIIYKIPTFKTDELRQLNELDDMDILDFNNTRLKPYLKMLKSRRVHNTTEVKAALLRN